jgi:hypothetical protein
MDEMSSKIGLTAGDIWYYLSENGKSSSPIKIKSVLGISNTMLYLALGWLSREDKIIIEQDEYSHKISLK